MGRINHTPFNLEQAINGKAFYLQNGYRGIIKYGVEDHVASTWYAGYALEFSYVGYILDDKGFLYKALASWNEKGQSNISPDYHATTMVEETIVTREEKPMKSFNVEEALQGNPVRLRNGLKAIIYYQVPDKYKFPNGDKTHRPLKGMIFNEEGYLTTSQVAWLNDGSITENQIDNFDIIGMYEEDISSLIQRAFKENLPLRTKNGGKVYIATILDLQNPMNRDYPVIAYDTDTAAFRCTLDGKFVDRHANLVDIIGLYEEED